MNALAPCRAVMALALLLASLLTACGGGGGESTGSGGGSIIAGGAGGGGAGGGGAGGSGDLSVASGGEGGISGTGIAYGTISAFGSIWVNGVEYDTTTATLKLGDGSTVAQAALRVGMVVLVDGSVGGANAIDVTVDEPLKGAVEQVLDASRMVVMGQIVRISPQTTFEGAVVPVVGDRVHVHGLVAGDGTVDAGYVEKRPGGVAAPFAVKGVVKAHDTVGQTFQIGTLTVSYAGATLSNLPAGSWNGLQMLVRNGNCAGNPVCGTLTALRVERVGPQPGAIAEAELEGYVSSVGGGGFVLGDQTVLTNGATVYRHGTSADVAVGVRLSVRGSIAAGVLTATRVTLADSARIEADIATTNGSQITLVGLPGVTVTLDANTVFKGKNGITAPAGLLAGHHLRIRGVASGSTVRAAEVELRSTSPDTRVILQAPLGAFADPQITLLGVAVDTSPLADGDFADLAEAPVSRAVFFGALANGAVVKMRGDLNVGLTVDWTDAERED